MNILKSVLILFSMIITLNVYAQARQDQFDEILNDFDKTETVEIIKPEQLED
jgi:hypothetical protein